LQLSETDNQDLPPFPDAKEIVPGAPDTGPILPVPKGIRPTLAKYRYLGFTSSIPITKSY